MSRIKRWETKKSCQVKITHLRAPVVKRVRVSARVLYDIYATCFICHLLPTSWRDRIDDFVWLHAELNHGVTSTAVGSGCHYIMLSHPTPSHHYHPASLSATPSSVTRDEAGVEWNSTASLEQQWCGQCAKARVTVQIVFECYRDEKKQNKQQQQKNKLVWKCQILWFWKNETIYKLELRIKAHTTQKWGFVMFWCVCSKCVCAVYSLCCAW